MNDNRPFTMYAWDIAQVNYMLNTSTREVVRITYTEALIYCYLAGFWGSPLGKKRRMKDKAKSLKISQRKIGERLNMDYRTVGKGMKKLEEVGVLQFYHIPQQRVCYKIAAVCSTDEYLKKAVDRNGVQVEVDVEIITESGEDF